MPVRKRQLRTLPLAPEPERLRTRALQAGHTDRNLSMKVIYMAHPVSGDIENNIKRAKMWMRWLEENYDDIAVCANWILECEIWDDNNLEHRAAGLRRDMVVLERCDELWLVGAHVSKGMIVERDHAEKRGLIIRDLTKQAICSQCRFSTNGGNSYSKYWCNSGMHSRMTGKLAREKAPDWCPGFVPKNSYHLMTS